MAAETLTNATLPGGYGQGLAGALLRQHYVVEIAVTALEVGDIFVIGSIPRNALVSGGFLVTDDMDTGAEALEIDLGFAIAGTTTATWTDTSTGVTYTNAAAAADPDGFVNSGVLTGDVQVDEFAAGVNYRPILLPYPLWFSAKTTLQAEVIAAATTMAAGTLAVYLDYQITG